jgi:hypothetical protein
VFDESHAADKALRRRRGWAPRGHNACVYEYFTGDGSNRSVLGVMKMDGFVLQCSQVINGNVDGDKLVEWAEEFLFPLCGPGMPIGFLVMDNCSTHYDVRFLQGLAACLGTAYFFLTPYSPDMSPIEGAFHQVRVMCTCPQSPRTHQPSSCPPNHWLHFGVWRRLSRICAGITRAVGH